MIWKSFESLLARDEKVFDRRSLSRKRYFRYNEFAKQTFGVLSFSDFLEISRTFARETGCSKLEGGFPSASGRVAIACF